MLEDLPAGARVPVYRTTTSKWEGPFMMISRAGEIVVVQTRRGRSIFRSTCVKAYVYPNPSLNYHDDIREKRFTRGTEENHKEEIVAHTAEARSEPNEKTKLSAKVRDAISFATSRKAELDGLLKNGTLLPLQRSDLLPNTRVFGSRFIDQLKKSENETRRKSLLVAQNYADDGARQIATEGPTVQSFSQHFLLRLVASV